MKYPKFCVFRLMPVDESLLLSKVCKDFQEVIDFVKGSNGDEFLIVPLDFSNSLSVHYVDNKIMID